MGENIKCAFDSKAVCDQMFHKIYDLCSVEVQKKMVLITSEYNDELPNNNDNIIFYSPQITTGVDMQTFDSKHAFIHITGKSVSSIALLQMSTRTRNMKSLHYFSSARCNESKFNNIKDCKEKLEYNYLLNQCNYSFRDITEFEENEVKFNKNQSKFFDIFCANEYLLDCHSTNKTFFFEEELTTCGFVIEEMKQKKASLNSIVKKEMKTLCEKNINNKVEVLIEALEDNQEIEIDTINKYKQTCNMLNITKKNKLNNIRI
jgi:hypothetical protein